MAMMDVCGPVYCPSCKPEYIGKIGKRRRSGIILDCSSSNYSGTGTDLANCPQCGKGYIISYKIESISRDKTLDIDLNEEKRREIEYLRHQANDLIAKAAELSKKADKEELDVNTRIRGNS